VLLAVLRHLPLLLVLSAPTGLAAGPEVPEQPDSGPVVVPNEAMTEADKAFRFQDYDRAIVLLKGLQETSKGTSLEPEVLERLGASYWFIDALDAARRTFTALLKLQSDHRLDTLFYPAELIDYFESQKAFLTEHGFIRNHPPGPGDQKAQPAWTLVRTVTQRSTPTLAYLMPFGVGQFLNEKPSAGTLHAALQGVGFVANAVAWIRIQNLKVEGTNLISQRQEGEAKLLQVMWWTGSAIFVTSYGWSVIDGLLGRLPPMEEKRTREILDPRELPTSGASSGVGVRLIPSPFGLGLSGTF
jgi:hypothetical protein